MNDRPEAKALRWDEIVSSGSIRMETPLKGDVYLGLENENGSTLLTGGGRSATIYVNVSAWVRTREYEDYKIPKYRTHPKYVTLNKQRMSVKTSKVRVNAQ